MKLNEFRSEVLWEGEIGGEDYAFVIEDGIAKFTESFRPGKVRGHGLASLGTAALAGLATAYAVDAFQKYKRNKRTTTTFYAKDTQERALYKDIVDTLMRTGKFKKTKEQYIDGGYLWVLQKTR